MKFSFAVLHLLIVAIGSLLVCKAKENRKVLIELSNTSTWCLTQRVPLGRLYLKSFCPIKIACLLKSLHFKLARLKKWYILTLSFSHLVFSGTVLKASCMMSSSLCAGHNINWWWLPSSSFTKRCMRKFTGAPSVQIPISYSFLLLVKDNFSRDFSRATFRSSAPASSTFSNSWLKILECLREQFLLKKVSFCP